MIGSLKGTVENLMESPVLLWAGPVGYNVYLTPSTIRSLTEGQEIHLHIHSHVRDDAFELYGFLSGAERRLFELLLTVGGIGPKTALPVVDKGVEHILSAIRRSDITPFLTVPRLGQKNAKKIIIELQSKIGSITDDTLLALSPKDDELMEALMSVGFNRREIEKIIRQIPTEKPLEQRVKTALQLLAK